MQPQSFDVRLFWWAYWSYLGAFLFFVVFGATRGRRAGLVANAVTSIGFVAHTLGLIWRWKISGHVPMANMYEYASLLAWMAVLSYLFIVWRYRRTIVGSFVIPVVIAVMTCASMLPKEITQQLMPALQSYWLAIHVSLAALGEGAFAVALAVSIMYLVKSRRGDDLAGPGRAPSPAPAAHRSARMAKAVSRHPAVGLGHVAVLDADDDAAAVDRLLHDVSAIPAASAALPSLRLLDEINYRAVAIGYPLFTIGGLFAGAIWAYEAWGSFWSWDPKEVGALIVWLFYTAYLHARLQKSWYGRRAAWLSIAGFVIVVLSFLGNLWLGGQHSYN